MKAVDREDKSAVRGFWKKFRIMAILDNITELWDDVKLSSWNCVCKSIWLDCSIPQVEIPHQIPKHMVIFEKKFRFKEVTHDDARIHGIEKGFSYEELMLLVILCFLQPKETEL